MRCVIIARHRGPTMSGRVLLTCAQQEDEVTLAHTAACNHNISSTQLLKLSVMGCKTWRCLTIRIEAFHEGIPVRRGCATIKPKGRVAPVVT
jgi:hypothetical protein